MYWIDGKKHCESAPKLSLVLFSVCSRCFFALTRTLFPLMKASPNLFFSTPPTHSDVSSNAMFMYPSRHDNVPAAIVLKGKRSLIGDDVVVNIVLISHNGLMRGSRSNPQDNSLTLVINTRIESYCYLLANHIWSRGSINTSLRIVSTAEKQFNNVSCSHGSERRGGTHF